MSTGVVKQGERLYAILTSVCTLLFMRDRDARIRDNGVDAQHQRGLEYLYIDSGHSPCHLPQSIMQPTLGVINAAIGGTLTASTWLLRVQCVCTACELSRTLPRLPDPVEGRLA